MYDAVIKWSGSKRSQANEILQYFPKEINTYYEPFIGGGSILRRLLDTDIIVNQYICSDINKDLIELWNKIKNVPNEVIKNYNYRWNELNKNTDIERKKEYFNLVRKEFNNEHNPLDFMFIMRTTTNGMPRYNKAGEFNNSFHCTRNGIQPQKLEKIINEWSQILNKNNVNFINCSYEQIIPTQNDFLYLDPPYANTKGMYYGAIDYNKLWQWIRNLPCKYALSFDGISGKIDNTYLVPNDLYSKHEYILSGNSSFKRIIGKSNASIVYESLYIK